MGTRTNKEAGSRDSKGDKPAETVLVFNTDVEDPYINPPKDAANSSSSIPRPDDQNVMTEIPDWMAAAIASREPLQVTDDPNLAGTVISNNGISETNIITPPLQASLNDLNATRLEKKELLTTANFQRESIKAEREYYGQQRIRRAVEVPEVPSGKRPYPEGVVISYSPYSVQDMEDLNNNDISDYDKYRIQLEGIYTSGMSPLELTFSDFTFICDARHVQALGDVYFKYPYVCRVCGKPGLYSFTLGEVGFASLKSELPIQVRFHSFPKEIFLFTPHTIGDVMHLMSSGKYWRTLGEDYITSDKGKKMIDRVAVNACRCVSHSWEEAYFKLLEASENPEDRSIMADIGKALYHDVEPIKFECAIPVDKKGQRQAASATSDVVEGLVSGELSTITPNADTKPLPPWMMAHAGSDGKVSGVKKLCGAVNEIDVLAGDIIIPFRRHPVNLEYGVILK